MILLKLDIKKNYDIITLINELVEYFTYSREFATQYVSQNSC